MDTIDSSYLAQFASDYGLMVRGGFNVQAEDNVPAINSQTAAGSLVLFGNAGSSMWEKFSSSEEYRSQIPHPLDKWSERIGHIMAKKFGGTALFPFGGPPHRPFLQWVQKAEGLRPSKLGIFIHPLYGLWHAYRFAIAFPELIDSENISPNKVLNTSTDICANCAEKPCLQACPVGAFDGKNYAVDKCYQHLSSTNVSPDCVQNGCAARQACPVGVEFQYQPAHAQFHMNAFFVSRRNAQ